MGQNKELKRLKPDNTEVTKYDFLICPNCGTEEVGKYCPNCGQSNKDFNKPLKEIMGDLLDSINIDIRLFNTLVPFFFKPGKLTEEYFKGKRRRYVAPMRMYILFSVLFFFLAQFADLDNADDIVKMTDDSVADSVNQELALAFTETDKQFKNAIEAGGMPLDSNSLVYTDYIKDSAKGKGSIVKWTIETENDTNVKTLNSFSSEEIQKIREDIDSDSTISEGVKEIVGGGLNAAEKKELFYEKFLKNISYLLFLLMPLFAGILGITLFRSKKMYVHHLIFSINYHSFIFAFSSFIILLGMILPNSIFQYTSYLFWFYPLYLMLGIKRYYSRTYVGAFFKTIGISLLYYFIIFVTMIIIIVLTAKGFYEG